MEITTSDFKNILGVCIEDSEGNDITLSMQNTNGFYIESWVDESENTGNMHAFGSLTRKDFLSLLTTTIEHFDLIEEVVDWLLEEVDTHE